MICRWLVRGLASLRSVAVVDLAFSLLKREIGHTLGRSATGRLGEGSDGSLRSPTVKGMCAREDCLRICSAWKTKPFSSSARWRRVSPAGNALFGRQGFERHAPPGAEGLLFGDAALLVDARKGLRERTRRHAAIVSLLGIRRVILAVNKIDLVDFSEARYREIEAAFAAFAPPLSFRSILPIALSARHGDNVTTLSARTTTDPAPSSRGRRPEGRASGGSAALSGAAGQSPRRRVPRRRGNYSVRQRCRRRSHCIAGSGRISLVERIVTFDGDLPPAEAGRSVTLTFAEDLDPSVAMCWPTPRTGPLGAAGSRPTSFGWMRSRHCPAAISCSKPGLPQYPQPLLELSRRWISFDRRP
jgi:Elongation factor Tu GTP binding domain